MRSRTEALHSIELDALLQCGRSIRQVSIGRGGTFAHRIRTVPRVRLQHITQPIGLRFAFSSENGERDIAFNANFRSARMPCPFMGRTSSPPQTWDFAVICAHIGAHAMLHSDIACAPAPGARLRAFRPEYQGKCRTRQFPLDNSRILRIQSVYTVIATPPEPVASAARLPVSATGSPVVHISESIRIRLFLLDGINQFRLRWPLKAVFNSQVSLPAISQ